MVWFYGHTVTFRGFPSFPVTFTYQTACKKRALRRGLHLKKVLKKVSPLEGKPENRENL
jgi:hypothetical protein